ncbi:unnamed protein product [Sphagnum balticum]
MASRWSSFLRYFSSTRGYSGPVAIQVGYAPGAGRGVFAVRDIAVGDLIHTADPVVAHPALASLQKVFYSIEKEADWSLLHAYCR